MERCRNLAGNDRTQTAATVRRNLSWWVMNQVQQIIGE
jgi:hypothetical protein